MGRLEEGHKMVAPADLVGRFFNLDRLVGRHSLDQGRNFSKDRPEVLHMKDPEDRGHISPSKGRSQIAGTVTNWNS
ncbi:hypothetical protein HJG40_13010 [Acidithiobacillus sp. ATCC 19703]|uniref:Uncharacterized protein n=2 Tax=Acidithiobacillus concretivorus TaxID=3063952 RepID=A0ABS5ZUN7_9PROT|nr:hypothetical protein [Acidithiobacillus concretivorus]